MLLLVGEVPYKLSTRYGNPSRFDTLMTKKNVTDDGSCYPYVYLALNFTIPAVLYPCISKSLCISEKANTKMNTQGFK